MKITQATLKQLIAEELAKLTEKTTETVEEAAFAPNHYCVHHGGVHHEGKTHMAEAVNHNWNEELGRVTHYDMKLSDGTILENVAFEDIQVTEASLAEAHHAHVAKRDVDDKEVDEAMFGRKEKKSAGAMKKRLVIDILDELAEHFADTESAAFVAARVRLAKGTLERL